MHMRAPLDCYVGSDHFAAQLDSLKESMTPGTMRAVVAAWPLPRYIAPGGHMALGWEIARLSMLVHLGRVDAPAGHYMARAIELRGIYLKNLKTRCRIAVTQAWQRKGGPESKYAKARRFVTGHGK